MKNKIPTMKVKLSKDGLTVSGKCPHCERIHTHGAGGEKGPDFGHVIGHCDNPMNPGYYLSL